MKTFVTLLMLISVFYITSRTAQAQVRLGIQVGLSIPDLTGGNNEISQGYTSRLAPNFGITAEFGVTNNFSIEPQVNFDGQGGQRNGMQPITNFPTGTQVPPGINVYANFKNVSILNYLEIPVLAKYTWGLGGFGLEVNAGPFVGFLLNASEKSSGTSSIYLDKNGGTPVYGPVSLDATTGVTSSIQRVNAGVAGGVGVVLPVSSRGDLSLEVRGLYGLTNVQKYAEDGTSHTGNLIVSLGYSYELL